MVILAAGAVRSAALLLASAEGGLANRSDVVGRHFMNHNLTAVLATDPRFTNDAVHQKTFGINDFYLPAASTGRRSATSSCSAASRAPFSNRT